ncbi:glutathione hydrolase 6-like isoform X2 [Galleria mellonella]|uniref:Glutathione hydrolase 6-like isoform X2 n=1 Tax=Galleria mellonella TaxID=7137 RepID=A0ABM3N2I3_GALME|nr:glutathione hydrolase 6-like isoform X2 [Galleria mellonella]
MHSSSAPVRDARDSPDSQPTGVVELREDVPLKASTLGGSSARCCAGGPRFILACFAALSAAITLALLTQIYYGDYEVVPHGSVSSSAAACSRAGTDALLAGGRALDAALAAALCLAVVAPHRTSLDASGSLLYWEYRQARSQPPLLAEWGGAGRRAAGAGAGEAPRAVAALAALHARLGALPWSRLLQPAIDLARDGFPVSEGLTSVETTTPESRPGAIRRDPALARYLQSLQRNTSAELAAAWGGAAREAQARPVRGAGWRALLPRAGPAAALRAALAAPAGDTDLVINELQRYAEASNGTWPPSSVATGLAVVDRLDTYVALVTGLSTPFGSGPPTAEGWIRDEPSESLDLAPAIITEDFVCGTRYVVGAESWAALAQAAAALVHGGAPGGVERARLALQPRGGGALAGEAARPAPAAGAAPPYNATPPYAAVNVVQQRGDALLSHADSRGGGLASRF